MEPMDIDCEVRRRRQRGHACPRPSCRSHALCTAGSSHALIGCPGAAGGRRMEHGHGSGRVRRKGLVREHGASAAGGSSMSAFGRVMSMRKKVEPALRTVTPWREMTPAKRSGGEKVDIG